MVDRIYALAWDQKVFGEAEPEQPTAKGLGVITDDAGPDALLRYSTRDSHDRQPTSRPPNSALTSSPVGALVDADVADTREESPDQWPGFLGSRGPEPVARVRLLEPVRARALTLIVTSTLVDGLPFGLEIGASNSNAPAVLLEAVPDCGCDACDTGSADLLESLDNCLFAVARGGVVHARDDRSMVTRKADGWKGSGLVSNEHWLDEDQDLPAGVQRWQGLSWR